MAGRGMEKKVKAMKLAGWKIVFLLLVGAMGSSAWAGHTRVGVVVGPGWGPWYYPPPYYYYPPYQPIIIQRPPQVYIEQYAPAPDAAPAPDQTNYWYFCPASKAYYPYVKACPSGWLKVLPQPPAPQ